MADRIFYAMQNLAIKERSKADYTLMSGVQSVAMTTNFNLEQVFQLGQLGIYQNIEGVPDIEMTTSKALDGTCLLYNAACGERNTSLTNASSKTFDAKLGLWNESVDTDSINTPANLVMLSGCTIGSIGYTFGADSFFTEDMTIAANNKIWQSPSCTAYPLALGDLSWGTTYSEGSPVTVGNPGGVQRRELFDMVNSTLPIAGAGAVPEGKSKIQSISVSCDFGLEDLVELGTFTPYKRVASFPIEVTCDIEVNSTGGDKVNATESGCTVGAQCDGVSQLTDQTIILKTCDGTQIDLGTANKLSSVSYGGGDAGGGNVTVTYSYSNFNDLLISGSVDPTA